MKIPSSPLACIPEIDRINRKIRETNDIVTIEITESQTGANKDREGVERRGVREQEEGRGGAAGGAGERPGPGRELQAGGHLRAAASSLAALPREDYGECRSLSLHVFLRVIIFGSGKSSLLMKHYRVDTIDNDVLLVLGGRFRLR